MTTLQDISYDIHDNSTSSYSNETPDILNVSDHESEIPSAVSPQKLTPSGSTTTTSSSAVITDAVYVTIGAVGLFGNLFVVVVILSWTNMRRKVTNIFIINQSLIDLVTSIVLIVTIGIGWRGSWRLNDDSISDIWMTRSVLWGLMMSSTYSVLALTVER